MDITTVTVSMFETNCYLVFDKESGEGIIIDPGDEAERIVAEIGRLGFTPKMILLTHGHGDHIGAVNDIREHFHLPVAAGEGEKELLASPEKNMSAAVGMPIACPEPERLLRDGEEVSFGGETLTVLATPGHSPGGVCYLSGKVLFCGDTLFSGSVGRTDFPGCSHTQLIRSITDKLLPLADDTVCYPGHGPATTIGRERRQNPFLTGGCFA